jgi:hypothetical protein
MRLLCLNTTFYRIFPFSVVAGKPLHPFPTSKLTGTASVTWPSRSFSPRLEEGLQHGGRVFVLRSCDLLASEYARAGLRHIRQRL